MLKVWKFPLATIDAQAMIAPRGARPLCVQVQGDPPMEHPCLWAIVDPAAELVTRIVRVYGTGHPIVEEHGEYVGTYQMSGGALVFHVFLLPE